MGPAGDVRIERYGGPHRDLEGLFRLAEDSDQMLDGYIDLGAVWVARDGDTPVGHAQGVPSADGTTWELKSLAVVEARRGTGVGRLLVERIADEARSAGSTRLEVSTATADAGNLRFYQRCGFRVLRVVRDAFGPHTGYHEPIEIDGIALRDQIWFDMEL